MILVWMVTIQLDRLKVHPGWLAGSWAEYNHNCFQHRKSHPQGQRRRVTVAELEGGVVSTTLPDQCVWSPCLVYNERG
jgi:hypothetical protein